MPPRVVALWHKDRPVLMRPNIQPACATSERARFVWRAVERAGIDRTKAARHGVRHRAGDRRCVPRLINLRPR